MFPNMYHGPIIFSHSDFVFKSGHGGKHIPYTAEERFCTGWKTDFVHGWRQILYKVEDRFCTRLETDSVNGGRQI